MERLIHKEAEIAADAGAVWRAWTTSQGIRSFFAPACRIELTVHGAYEILFDPSAKPGLQGGEGCQILAIQPDKMLTFTWSAPPHLPEARRQRTCVVVRLQVLSSERTQVILTHIGWGDGGEWDQAYEYFDKAWATVLYRLQVSFDRGPIDWSDPPRPG